MNGGLPTDLTPQQFVEIPDTIFSDKYKKIDELFSSEIINLLVREDKLETKCVQCVSLSKDTNTAMTIPVHGVDELIPVIPRDKVSPHTFKTLKSWEGVVLSTASDSFTARIIDELGQADDEEVEILLEEISEDDLHLVCEGAFFNWHIGYSTERGQRKRSSVVKFRRMHRWAKGELQKANELATDLSTFFSAE